MFGRRTSEKALACYRAQMLFFLPCKTSVFLSKQKTALKIELSGVLKHSILQFLLITFRAFRVLRSLAGLRISFLEELDGFFRLYIMWKLSCVFTWWHTQRINWIDIITRSYPLGLFATTSSSAFHMKFRWVLSSLYTIYWWVFLIMALHQSSETKCYRSKSFYDAGFSRGIFKAPKIVFPCSSLNSASLLGWQSINGFPRCAFAAWIFFCYCRRDRGWWNQEF